MSYEYSQVNRFENPHTYMYTKYEGKFFLKRYFASRNACIEKFKNEFNEAEKFGNLLNFPAVKFSTSPEMFLESSKCEETIDSDKIKEFLTEIKSKEVIQTTVLFRTIANLMLFCKKKDLDFFYEILSTFVKKYEIFKKIFSEYSPNFRKKGTDYTSLNHYILISFCALYYYSQIPNIKFLNGALKINDALCSVIDKVVSMEDSFLLSLILLMEREAVEQLIMRKEIGV